MRKHKEMLVFWLGRAGIQELWIFTPVGVAQLVGIFFHNQQVAGCVPGLGCTEGNLSVLLSHINVSPFPFLTL